jgi:outer membrane protein assembly factor BamA
MQHKIKYCYCLFFALLCSRFLLAQQPATDSSFIAADTASREGATPILVGNVEITGNRKTKDFIILREIPFRNGETYPLSVLLQKFEDARRQLMNTALFHNVVVAAKNFEGNKVTISVTVKERWYLFPVPFLKPVDRNLNQWLVEQKASLNRVNYGMRLKYYNASGRNDKLSALVGLGYTRQFSISYDRLYIDKKFKWGMSFGFATGKNKEVNYNTVNDKQVFIKINDEFLSNYTNAYVQLTYRRKIKTRHSFGIAFSRQEVGDTIPRLNPSYFYAGKKMARYPELYYGMTYYDLDYIPYPTKGYAALITVEKKGLSRDMNLTNISARAAGYWHVWPKTFFGLNVYGGVKFPFKQPYFNQRFLGYGDTYMQGYEYYVIDGVAGGYIKGTLTHELVNFRIRIPPFKKGKEAEHIPIRIFGKIFGNTGYVHNPEPGDNFLSNKMLYSGGFGIDILTFYDITFKLEWSFNQLGQNGIFVHRKSIF